MFLPIKKEKVIKGKTKLYVVAKTLLDCLVWCLVIINNNMSPIVGSVQDVAHGRVVFFVINSWTCVVLPGEASGLALSRVQDR